MSALAHYFPTGISAYLVGGLCIGLGVALLFILTGYIGGVSTFFSAVWSFISQWPHFQQHGLVTSRSWRLMYAVGMVLGAVIFTFAVNHGRTFVTRVPPWQLLIGGLIGGFGARYSGGCTSGHGICGLGSLQKPSLAAVITFVVTAIITAHVIKLIGGV